MSAAMPMFTSSAISLSGTNAASAAMGILIIYAVFGYRNSRLRQGKEPAPEQ